MASSLSRRRFLEKSALAAGAVAGAGALLRPDSFSRVEAAGDRATTTLNVMYVSSELTAKDIKTFEKAHPGVKINLITYDPVRLSTMFSSGNPPDFIRTVGAPDILSYVSRGLAQDLTSYFAKSKVLNPSQLAPINDVYRWNGKTQGQGARYGMAKDWSQDGTLWYNEALFKKAGVKPLSGTEPVSYDELLAMGKKLTKRSGNRFLVYGLDIGWGIFMQGKLIQMLAQEGKSLWNSDYSEVDFTTPEARKAIKWYVDWAQARVGPSPIDPYSGTSEPFFANRKAIDQWGYWFHGDIVANVPKLLPQYAFAPAPMWGSKRVSACFAGTGAWIPQRSSQKDLAWTFMEYFMSGLPAYERATGGWGLPSLKKYRPDVPHATSFDKRTNAVQANEEKYLTVLHYSPYIGSDAMEAAIVKYIEPIMHGKTSLDNGIRDLQNAVNQLLARGKAEANA